MNRSRPPDTITFISNEDSKLNLSIEYVITLE